MSQAEINKKDVLSFIDKVMGTYKGTFLVVPVLLVFGVLVGGVFISGWYDLWLLTSVKIAVLPLPLVAMIVVGVAGNCLRVFISKRKPRLDPWITTLMVLLVIATPPLLGPAQADMKYYRDADSCATISFVKPERTVYEDGKCLYRAKIQYLEQGIRVKETKASVFRQDAQKGYVEGREYTVYAGSLDGKEYKDGDTIFVPAKGGQYSEVETTSGSVTEVYIGTIKTQIQKWDVELGVDANLNIDGKEYDKAGKLVWGTNNIGGNYEREHGPAVYLRK